MKPFSFLFICILFAASCKKTEEISDARQVSQYSIEQFYGNTRFSGGFFSPDETKLLVNSDESGIFNLYEINIADGIKKPITSSTSESFYAVDYVPGTDLLIYSAHKGGNEIDHLYLLDSTGQSKDLTPAEQEKASFFKWSQDKKSIFYQSNKRDPKYFDVYKMPVGNWTPTLVYENKDGLDVGDISFDENFIVVSKPITSSENELHLINKQSGERKEISQSDQKGSYSSSGFSKDNKYLYYITDAGKEFAYLVQYDIQTGERKTLYEANWDVMFSYLSENEKFRVIAINEDGKNKIIVQEAATGTAIDFPQIPDGDVQGINISNSEKLMRLSVGTSKAPNNIYVYNIETKELKKLTESQNKEINGEDLVAAEVVRFKSFDGLEIPAIYY
ncbi:MAG TPA: DPP IV N-terminal domain-containing protein, partial [Saprospiraceae bacterium]|nr:DPP IV N-terminal domain-containing protein [Saprospiraceae bacterium]